MSSMQDKYSVVIVGASPPEVTTIRQGVEDLVQVVGVEPDSKKLQKFIKAHGPDIAILYLDENSSEVLTAAKAASLQGDAMVIIVSKSREPNVILQSMRSGARDFAFFDNDDAGDIRRAIGDIGSLREELESTARGKIITVFSAKGGSGATTIASNLAGTLLTYALPKKAAHRKVILLDFDFEMGDVLAFLDVELLYTYSDVLSNMHRLDMDLLSQSLSIHSSGLYALAQTDQVEQAEDLSAEDMKRLLAFLVKHFDYVIIDGLRDFRELSITALDKSSNIVLTATADIPALKNANRCLQLFAKLGYPPQKVKLIINRYEKTKNLSIDSMEDGLGRRINGVVSNHFPSVIRSINQGELLVRSQPNCKVAKDIRDLGGMFIDEGTAPPAKRSFLPFGRSK